MRTEDAALDVHQYAGEATSRLVALTGTTPVDWRAVVEKGLAAAYEQSDAVALTSMVQVIAHLLDGGGRFEDAVGEVDHALAFALNAPAAFVLLLGLKASLLAAAGRMDQARSEISRGETYEGRTDAVSWTKFRVYRRVVLWQALKRDSSDETDELLRCLSVPALARERTFLLTWLVPFLATLGDRRTAHPWIRAIRLEAERSRSRWRLSDVAAFETWDDFLNEPEARSGKGSLETANSMSVWRGEAIHLREAVLRRNEAEAAAALRSMTLARRRLGSADVGGIEQFQFVSGMPRVELGEASSSPPVGQLNLNNLGAWLAEAEWIASQGSQAAAGEWLAALDDGLPAFVRSSLEWPISVSRLKGLLALRSGNPRRARTEFQEAIDWAHAVGFPAETALSLLQMGELCASADLRVPERVWQGQRRDGAEGLQRLGYDPMPHAYAVAHSLTLSSRNRLAERLTPREVEVLAKLAEGMSYRKVAESLGIAAPTVQTLAHRAYQKLGTSGRMVAVAEAKRLGVL